MKKNNLPNNKRECPHKCSGELRYYHEGNEGDYYYCDKCYKIAMWDEGSVFKSDNEAYPNSDNQPTLKGVGN